MSYKCHHCYIFSSDLPRALEYQTQIFIDINQNKLADCWQHFSLRKFHLLNFLFIFRKNSNTCRHIIGKLLTQILVHSVQSAPRKEMKTESHVKRFWLSFLQIWKTFLTKMSTYRNHKMITTIKYAYTWDIWWSRDRLVVGMHWMNTKASPSSPYIHLHLEILIGLEPEWTNKQAKKQKKQNKCIK